MFTNTFRCSIKGCKYLTEKKKDLFVSHKIYIVESGMSETTLTLHGRCCMKYYLQVRYWNTRQLKWFCRLCGVENIHLPRDQLINIAIIELMIVNSQRYLKRELLLQPQITLPVSVSMAPFGCLEWNNFDALPEKISWVYTFNRRTRIKIAGWADVVDFSVKYPEQVFHTGHIIITNNQRVLISIFNKLFAIPAKIEQIKYVSDVLMEEQDQLPVILNHRQVLHMNYDHGYLYYRQIHNRVNVRRPRGGFMQRLIRRLNKRDEAPLDEISIESSYISIHGLNKISKEKTPNDIQDVLGYMGFIRIDPVMIFTRIHYVNVLGSNEYFVVVGERGTRILVFVINLISQQRFTFEIVNHNRHTRVKLSCHVVLGGEVLLISSNAAVMVASHPRHIKGIEMLAIHLEKKRWEVIQLKLPITLGHRITSFNVSNHHYHAVLLRFTEQSMVPLPDYLHAYILQWIPKDLQVVTYSELTGQQQWCTSLFELLNGIFAKQTIDTIDNATFMPRTRQGETNHLFQYARSPWQRVAYQCHNEEQQQ